MADNIEMMIVDEQSLRDKIYVIRGQQVMLDFELAEIYGYSTTRFNEQVTRNIDKFDPDFMFELTKEEFQNLISQNATSSWGGTRKLPYAFTENGVAMLSSVLRSPLAIQVNIGIMRTFTEFRRISSSLALQSPSADIAQLRKDFEELKLDIEDVLRDQNDINELTRTQLDAISTALAELQVGSQDKKPRRRIGFIQDKE